jgi:hypothetical protein
LNGRLNLGEVFYFFQLNINNTETTLALVSVYSEPDIPHLKASNNTVWSCTYHGDAALAVIDVKTINAVVSMIPHVLPHPSQPEVGRWFLMEMPGLDVAQMGGICEDLTEE